MCEYCTDGRKREKGKERGSEGIGNREWRDRKEGVKGKDGVISRGVKEGKEGN